MFKKVMRLSVTIYGWANKVEGEIVWDRTRITASGSRGVLRCAREPIFPYGVSKGPIKPDEEPEKFMRNLYLMYRSPYFYAVKARRRL
jgi:hypothetical protein